MFCCRWGCNNGRAHDPVATRQVGQDAALVRHHHSDGQAYLAEGATQTEPVSGIIDKVKQQPALVHPWSCYSVTPTADAIWSRRASKAAPQDHIVDRDAAHGRAPRDVVDQAFELRSPSSKNDTLRRVFNSGHRGGGRSGRASGKGVATYSCYAPLSLVVIGSRSLPLTGLDRSIVIPMTRRTRLLRRFNDVDPAISAELGEIHRALSAWSRGAALNSAPAAA